MKKVFVVTAAIILLFGAVIPVKQTASKSQREYQRKIHNVKELYQQYLSKKGNELLPSKEVFYVGTYSTNNSSIVGISYATGYTVEKTNICRVKVSDWKKLFPDKNDFIVTADNYKIFCEWLKSNI